MESSCQPPFIDITNHLKHDSDSPTSVTETTESDKLSDDSSSESPVSTTPSLLEENKQLKECIARLEKDIARLETEVNGELFSIQLETLEKSVEQYKSEAERLKTTLQQQQEQSAKRIKQLEEQFNAKIERLTEKCTLANKERENMVMKYAVSENNALSLQKQIKLIESKLLEQLKEKDGVDVKLKTVINDKAKLAQQLDSKLSQIQMLDRDVQKWRDELNSQSSNLKFFQNKLKLELESHKETQVRLEKTTRELRDAKEETEQVRRDTQEMLRKYEEDGRRVLGVQDAEELQLIKKKYNDLLQENNQLCMKVQTLETERLEFEQNLSKARQSANQHERTVLDLQAATSELESTKRLLNRERERLAEKEAEIDLAKQTEAESQLEAETCRSREAELLVFTQKLTEKNVAIQSDLTGLEARVQLLDSQLTSCRKELASALEELSIVKEEFEREKSQRIEETELLTRHLTERTETAQKLSQQLEDQIGENQLLKKKHLASVKELTREVQSLRKRGEAAETISLGKGSHTSSNTSLNNLDPEVKPELDRQLLIEKIVKVQRSNARKQEKIEFLEEHTQQLVAELQRKSKIIQSLVMRQQTGALAPESVDENKAALAKHGGIMASVYNSKALDEAMTLEFSLEITKKLQAVLEDTLLKNITLKENMETLGSEIARLSSSRSVDPT